MTEAAISLLKATSYFKNVSESFVNELAAGLIPIDAVDGQVLIEEGEPMSSIVILEEGTLIRSKLSVQREDFKELKSSLRSLKSSSLFEEDSSVVIDELTGRGRVTGLLHSMHSEGEFSYACVSCKGPAKVWLLQGEFFRAVVSSKPEYCFDMLSALARELRSGSKSLQGLLKTLRGSSNADGSASEAKTLRCLCYDTTSWVKEGFQPAIEIFNKENQTTMQIVMDFTSERLGPNSAMYAAGYEAVCLFVNDDANEAVIQTLSLVGVKMIAMRCAGFDRVNAKAAVAYGLTVARVPAYSPYAVAEMAVSLLCALNRRITKASNRVKMANFTLDAGLMGMDIHGKTVGIMGTGKIGQILCNIMLGFGVKLLCYDIFENEDVKKAGGVYVTQDEIYTQSDILFLMMPLFPSTKHTINDSVLPKLKKGVLLINTSRGALVDTQALLQGLQSGIIGGVGMDVYENEEEYFFQDWSARTIKDPTLVSLLGLTNVILTAHQAFFTKEAVDKIVETTVQNLKDYANGLTSLQHPNNCLPRTQIPKP